MRNKKLIIILSIFAAIVLIVVVCGATFLVRHIETYNYYINSPDLDAEVIEASGIEMNSSMFFINEGDVKQQVEHKLANVGVINVERKFPDIVSINYVVYRDLFQFKKNGEFYQCYASGRVGGSSPERILGERYFTLYPHDDVSTTVGDYIQSDDGYDLSAVRRLVDALRTYTTPMTDEAITQKIDYVDLRSHDGHMIIKTRTGCQIDIADLNDGFEAALWACWSMYVSPQLDDVPLFSRAHGVIRATGYFPTDSFDPPFAV